MLAFRLFAGNCVSICVENRKNRCSRVAPAIGWVDACKGIDDVMPIRRTFEKSQRTFNLHAESIDLASEWLAEKLEVAGIEKSDRLRTRLLFEEALLNLAEHYGEEHEVTAHLEKRWGRCRLRLVVKGSRFNPLRPETELDAEGGWTSLFSVISMPVQYTYSMGANVLRLSLPKPVQNPVL